MTFASRLRDSLSASQQPPVAGHWHAISLCLDDTACEFLNVGVAFAHDGQVEVRMLDTFERLECLYDKRFSADNLQHLLIDIEHALEQYAGEPLPEQLSDTIHLGDPLFAQGNSAEEVVDEFFHDVVTLAKPTARGRIKEFKYYSSNKLRRSVIGYMIDELGIDAEKIIQNHPYELRLRNQRSIDVDVPLLSGVAVGGIVSGWYKSPLVVEKSILQASQDLTLVATHTDRVPAISILMPSSASGLTSKERTSIHEAADNQLNRLSRVGMAVLRAESNEELAHETIAWWRKHGAA